MTKPTHIRSAPLVALRAFEAAARLGSFKLAAHELSVTPAAISHQLAALEDYLGTPLFLRTNRLVQLTATGKILSGQVTSSFEQLQKALEQASAVQADEYELVVSAAPSIAAKWLVPRLSRFHAQHPEIDLRLSSENQTHDLIKDASVDIVLRYGKGEYSGLHAEKLWEETYLFPVCSPTTWQTASSGAIGQADSVSALSNQSLLRLPLPPDRITHEVGERWHAWLNALHCKDEAIMQQVAKGPFYSHEHLAIDIAKAGHGICLALDVLVIEDLLAHQLVRPLKLRSRDPYSHWLMYREQDAEKSKILAFANWIRAEAADSLKTLSSCRANLESTA